MTIPVKFWQSLAGIALIIGIVLGVMMFGVFPNLVEVLKYQHWYQVTQDSTHFLFWFLFWLAIFLALTRSGTTFKEKE